MSAEKKPWCWWRRFALSVGLTLATLAVFFVGNREAWIEPLPGVDLEPRVPPVAKEDLGPESSYHLLVKALGCIDDRDQAGRNWSARPDCWEGWSPVLAKFRHQPWPTQPPSAPSPASAGGSEADTGSFAPDAPWTFAQYQDVLQLSRQCEPAFALLDRALAASPLQRPDEEGAYERISRWRLYLLGQCLAISAHCRGATGDAEGCQRDLERLLGLVDLGLRGERTGGTCLSTGETVAEAARLIAVRDMLGASQLRDLARAALDVTDTMTPFVESVRQDAEYCSMVVEACYQMHRADLYLEDGSFGGPAVARPLWNGAVFTLAPLMGSTPERTSTHMQYWFQHLVFLAQQPYSADLAAKYDELRDKVQPLPGYSRLIMRTQDPLGLLLASSMFSHFGGIHARSATQDAQLRGMASFLAVKACEDERGALPERLEELVPDYLSRVPDDPFDGKPFRYLRSGVPGLPADAWAVYSIGDDFADDGGTAHSVGTCRDDAGPNPDLVWPSCPYPVPAD